MGKRQVRFHSPIIVPISPTNRIITGRYDEGYPFVLYRNAYNPLGGNPTVREKDGGKGPADTLDREIREEFNPSVSVQGDGWAIGEEIRTIQEAVLKGAEPLGDFYMIVPEVKGGRPAHKFIYSVFRSHVDEGVVDLAERNILGGRRLLTEGYAGVTDLDSLESGRHRLAHSSGLVVGLCFDRNIACLATGATAEPLGLPRESYQDYFKEFDYDPKVFRE